MTLETLVNLSDWGVSMILIGVRQKDQGNTGYNFEDKKWEENYLYTPQKLITIGAFRRTSVYWSLRKCRIVDVSSFNPANVESLVDIDTLRNQVTVFRVNVPTEKFPVIRYLNLRSPKLEKKNEKKSFGKWNNKKGEDKKQDSQSSTTSPVTDVEP